MKKNKPNPTQQSRPNPSLPDDLLLSCVARISRLYYPTLSLVSKSLGSLIVSPELYKARSLLGPTETCIYVCMQPIDSRVPTWYTLCRRPDQTLTNDTRKKSSVYVLARVSVHHSPPVDLKGLVAVGYSIYNIAESKSSSVSVLDCWTHAWREAPCFRVARGSMLPRGARLHASAWREAPCFRVELVTRSASVVDGKIYVAGSYEDGGSVSNLFEVYDTNSQVWDSLPMPSTRKKDNFPYKSACIDGKFHVETDTGVVAYDSKEGRWDRTAGSAMDRYLYSDSYCEIENILYSAMDGNFRWYDTKANKWRLLKGSVGRRLELHPAHNARLADYGGKMVVFWNRHFSLFDPNKKIWCAVIALEKRESGEIWGKVEWFDHVLTIPKVFIS